MVCPRSRYGLYTIHRYLGLEGLYVVKNYIIHGENFRIPVYELNLMIHTQKIYYVHFYNN